MVYPAADRPVIAWTFAASSPTVNPRGGGASASTAEGASGIRCLFKSTPPTRVAPSVDRVGSSSSTPSAMNPVSTQSSAVQNRSAIPASWDTISGRCSIIRAQRNSAVLCTIASNRSTRSPFVYALPVKPPEVQLEHGQVVARCLDRGFDHRGGSAGAAGTLRGAEHGAYFRHVQPGAGPVHHRVEDLLHAVSVGEEQVA